MSNSSKRSSIIVRNTEVRDLVGIEELSMRTYPDDDPWEPFLIRSHLRHFPEGQFVAIDTASDDQVVGMAASVIVRWDDYDIDDTYRAYTGDFMFTNHDPTGMTLYAGEVMVDPGQRRRGIGKMLYEARRDLVRRLGLRRIRAGARLRGYGAVAGQMAADAYVLRVIRGELVDPTLTFQLRQGFRVIAVVEDYFERDPVSRGCAAIIEWINHRVAARSDYRGRDARYGRPRRRRSGGEGHESKRQSLDGTS